MELIFAIVGLAAFDVLALRWGRDSTEGLESPEWDRRKAWRGFKHP